jgi:hypothetical protein
MSEQLTCAICGGTDVPCPEHAIIPEITWDDGYGFLWGLYKRDGRWEVYQQQKGLRRHWRLIGPLPTLDAAFQAALTEAQEELVRERVDKGELLLVLESQDRRLDEAKQAQARGKVALDRAQLAWENADVHPRCGTGSCEQCDTFWDTTFRPEALSGPGWPDVVVRAIDKLGKISAYCHERCEAGARGDWDGLADLADTAREELSG